MRIHLPRKGQVEGEVHTGLLRSIEKTPTRKGERYAVKISVPTLSQDQNFYLELTESDVDEWIEALQNAKKG